jgi:uncharacterized HAD superfamily protein
MEIRTYCFDIDGVICTNTWGEYEAAEPLTETIAHIARLHAEGHRILLHTARGEQTGLDWRALTERQMAEWGVPYHVLYMGKPTADLYVDDRGINVVDWLRDMDA